MIFSVLIRRLKCFVVKLEDCRARIERFDLKYWDFFIG